MWKDEKDRIIKKLRNTGCVFAEEEADVLLSSTKSHFDFTQMVDQRVSGLPLEYVVGWAEFCGLQIQIDRGVFVPRKRTEFLVHEAISLVETGATVVDICCGSGALSVAVCSALETFQLYAVDVDRDAVKCARQNVLPLGGHVNEGDLYDALPEYLLGKVDLLIVNAPYVPTSEINLLPFEAWIHEAQIALTEELMVLLFIDELLQMQAAGLLLVVI
jgi:release factor glutamine methyltransferase